VSAEVPLSLGSESADGVVVVDHAGLVMFASPAAAMLFGQEAERLTGARFGYPVVAGECCDIGVVCDGRLRVTEMRAAAVDWEGSPSALASLRDVTEQRRAAAAPVLRLGGGRLLATISTSFVAILRDHYGRGPMKAKTYAIDDAVIVVMRDSGFTTLEQTIMASGHPERVIAMRRDFLRMMSGRFTETIESLTGRKVIAFMSRAQVEPDLTMGTFFIDAPLYGFGALERLDAE
jgi:uncharacterized protein YbcI